MNSNDSDLVTMDNDGYNSWLKSLNVGDEVAIKHKNYISHNKTFYTKDKVKSITPDGLIKTVNFPHEFEYGVVIHDVWDSQTHTLIKITQDILDSIEKRYLINLFDLVDINELSLTQLREIKNIIGE
jgi:hypothetical protein